MQKFRRIEQITVEWLSELLGKLVTEFHCEHEVSNWAQHARILVTFEDQSHVRLWMKECLHPDIGSSEVDYYLKDYASLEDAPLLRCYDACYEEGIGYHLVLVDASEEFHDRKLAAPTLNHGLAIAEAVARLHRHYWESREPRSDSEWEALFTVLRPGLPIMERLTERSLTSRFNSNAQELVERRTNPEGQTLLHGDLNPTNILTPKDADSPVYFLDRQPLDGKPVYGLAVYDLAYAIAPWWPRDFRLNHEIQILRCWYEALNKPTYAWEQAQLDWDISVNQCLHVPLGYCISEESAAEMDWLWRWQLSNILGEGVSS